jgi:hypothetical protein
MGSSLGGSDGEILDASTFLPIDLNVSVRPNAPIVEGARGPGAIDGGGTSMDAKHTTA